MRIFLCILLLSAVTSPLAARTWRVEKDGSGDFTVIQDALDACAAGDSVLVGPGRFDDFRVATTLDGFTFSSIAHMKTSDVMLLGAGMDQTTVGPESLVVQVDGLNATCLVVDEVPDVVVRDLAFENAQFPINLKYRSLVERCRITNTGTNYAITILEGDEVEIRDCEFFGPRGIITSSPAVTRPQIVDCTFENLALDRTAIVIGNGGSDALISRCNFTGYASGVETSLGGTATIEDCYFAQQRLNIIDLSSGSITMRRCLIDPGARFPLSVNIGRLECYDTIIGGGTTATLLTWGDVTMRNCHLLNGGALTVDSRGAETRVVDVRSNWWGTTEMTQVASWITEFNPTVLYEPILQGPVPTRSHSFSDFKALFSGHE